MNGWLLDGQVDGGKDGWMNECQMNDWIDDWKNRWTDGQKRWMNKQGQTQLERKLDGWLDGNQGSQEMISVVYYNLDTYEWLYFKCWQIFSLTG